MKDMLDRTLEVGDRVVYGGRRFSSSYMAVGTITAMRDTGLTVRVLAHTNNDPGRLVGLTRVDRVVRLDGEGLPS